MPINLDSFRRDICLDVCPFDYQIANRVTGPFMQDCSIAVTGPKGSGKSTFSIYLAWSIAKHIAQMNDHDPDQWTKYFNVDTHLATVDKQGTKQLMGAIRGTKNNIFILDDVSISWGSRSFMTRENRTLNDIFTVMRTYQAVLILNMVDQMHVDIVPRTMCDYFIEMYRTYYTEGLALVKVFKQERNMRTGATMSKYLTDHDRRITVWVSKLPPKEMLKLYQEKRKEKTDELIERLLNPPEEEKKVRTKSSDKYRKKIMSLREDGTKVRDIAEQLHISLDTVYKVIREVNPNA